MTTLKFILEFPGPENTNNLNLYIICMFVTTIVYDFRFEELRFMITKVGTDYTLVKTSDGFLSSHIVRIIFLNGFPLQ